MAITINNENARGNCFDYRGLSSDTKPTDGVPNGSTFFEMDTGNFFMFNGASTTWVRI